jgi:hypothetical protein
MVCDVLLHREVTEEDLKPFLNKCNTLKSLKMINRCLFMMVAQRYTKEAFIKAKNNGIVPATPETLFGIEVAEGLVQLTEVLADAARACFNPDVFGELFQKLRNIEGAAINLRGVLFEYVAQELALQEFRGVGNIRPNMKFLDPSGRPGAEVDLIVECGDRDIYFIECKGYQPAGTVKVEFVKTWIEKRIPLIRKQALEQLCWKKQKYHFELWTTGQMTKEARELIEASKTTKYSIRVRDREEIYTMARETRNTSMIQTLEQHFMHHPLAVAELDIQKRPDKEQKRKKRSVIKEHAALGASPPWGKKSPF